MNNITWMCNRFRRWSSYGMRPIIASDTRVAHRWPSPGNQVTRQSSKKELVREVVDTNDIVWRVREVRLWNSAGKQVNSLLAERAGGFRKLWSYPSDWAELNDLELGNLINDPVPMATAARLSEPADADAEPDAEADASEAPSDGAVAAAGAPAVEATSTDGGVEAPSEGASSEEDVAAGPAGEQAPG